MSQSYMPMVEVMRGTRIESHHRGAVAVVDSRGRLVGALGNPKEAVYVRSSAKPFQALALVCSGAADAFDWTEEELALACGSHSGEPEQIALVESMMAKAGLEPADLQCGIHPPFDPATRRALAAAGQEPTVLHNNCSAKHAGMLAAARHLGCSTADYLDPEHDVQVAIRGLLAFLSGVDQEEIGLAVDGCAAPTFHLSLRGFALAWARLASAGEGLEPDEQAGEGEEESYSDPPEEEEEYAEYDVEDGEATDNGFPVSIPAALGRIWNAMKNHPVLVAGSRGRICTDIMRAAAQSGVPLVAKSGAEGVYALAAVQSGHALGITVKIEDGAERARNAAVIEILRQLDLLPAEAVDRLAVYHRPRVLNRRSDPVGEVRSRFRLNRGLPG